MIEIFQQIEWSSLTSNIYFTTNKIRHFPSKKLIWNCIITRYKFQFVYQDLVFAEAGDVISSFPDYIILTVGSHQQLTGDLFKVGLIQIYRKTAQNKKFSQYDTFIEFFGKWVFFSIPLTRAWIFVLLCSSSSFFL